MPLIPGIMHRDTPELRLLLAILSVRGRIVLRYVIRIGRMRGCPAGGGIEPGRLGSRLMRLVTGERHPLALIACPASAVVAAGARRDDTKLSWAKPAPSASRRFEVG
jgi:hypothetical protein